MPHKNPEQRRAYANARYKAIKEGRHIPGKVEDMRTGKNIFCDACGKEFYRSPANRAEHTNRGTNQYCSRECMANAYVGRNIGEEHPRWKGTLTVSCGNCKTPLERPLWTFTRGENQMAFCNHKCFGAWKSQNWTGEDNPYWFGGKHLYYGANWLRQSREARRRDNHICQFCGADEKTLRRALNVHHIKPFRFFGVENCKQANKLANLISLCDRCHTYLERFCHDGTIEDWTTLLQLGQKNQTK